MTNKNTKATAVALSMSVHCNAEKIIEYVPLEIEPIKAVRFSTTDYRIEQGVAKDAPYSEVNAQVLISATGEYINSDRPLPVEVDTASDYRFLPGTNVSSTEWKSEEASNIKFTYTSLKAPESVDLTWNSGKEEITRTGLRLDSNNSELLTSDFSIMGSQTDYAISIVYHARPTSGNTSCTLISTNGSSNPWLVKLIAERVILTSSENPSDLSNSTTVKNPNCFRQSTPQICVILVQKEYIKLHFLSKTQGYTTSSIKVNYSNEQPLSFLIGSDVNDLTDYADLVIHEINFYNSTSFNFSTSYLIKKIEQAYGVA